MFVVVSANNPWSAWGTPGQEASKDAAKKDVFRIAQGAKEDQPATPATDATKPAEMKPAEKPAGTVQGEPAKPAATEARAEALGAPKAPKPPGSGLLTIGVSQYAGYSRVNHPYLDLVVGQGLQNIRHNADQMLFVTKLLPTFAVTEQITIRAEVPFTYVRWTRNYLTDDNSQDVSLVYPNVHHRNEYLDGINDSQLAASYAYYQSPQLTLTAELGVSIPLGHTESGNPNILGAMEIPHQHFQFGTGTFDPLLGLGARIKVADFLILASANTKQVLYENSNHYKAPTIYSGTLRVVPPLGLNPFLIVAGADIWRQLPGRWDGVITNEGGLSERLDMYAVGGIMARPSPTMAAGFFLRYPFYRHIIGGADVTDLPAVILNVEGAHDFW